MTLRTPGWEPGSFPRYDRPTRVGSSIGTSRGSASRQPLAGEREECGMAVASLVTGAAGFIGSHVVDELIMMGHEVVALDDLSGGFRENVSPRARFIPGSCLDAALIEDTFREHCFRHVFHLAAYAAEGLSHFIRRF